jgi:hypothetical protein
VDHRAGQDCFVEEKKLLPLKKGNLIKREWVKEWSKMSKEKDKAGKEGRKKNEHDRKIKEKKRKEWNVERR